MEWGKKLRGIGFHENGTKKRHFTCKKVFYYFRTKANQNSTVFCNFGKKAFLMEGRKYIYTNKQKSVDLTQTINMSKSLMTIQGIFMFLHKP